jgi:3-oxoadipate enol-lactonase
MPHLEINGASLYYEDTGGGPEAALFIHGLLWSSKMFAPQIAALRGRYRCVALDLRGQGQSAVAASGYDMDTLADDAAALIEALGLAPVHFVGLSMGGFIGLRLAARRPGLLRSLSLLDTAADEEPRLNRPRYKLMGLVALAGGLPLLAGAVMKIMFGRAFLEDPARTEDRTEMRRQLLANDRVGAVRALEGVTQRKGIEGELSLIRTPTLVLRGDDDRAISAARARKTASLIPGARFVGIPRAGHSSTVEEPQAVSAELAAFLGSVR